MIRPGSPLTALDGEPLLQDLTLEIDPADNPDLVADGAIDPSSSRTCCCSSSTTSATGEARGWRSRAQSSPGGTGPPRARRDVQHQPQHRQGDLRLPAPAARRRRRARPAAVAGVRPPRAARAVRARLALAVRGIDVASTSGSRTATGAAVPRRWHRDRPARRRHLPRAPRECVRGEPRAGDGWLIEEREGVVHALGDTADTRIGDPDHPDRVSGGCCPVAPTRPATASTTGTSRERPRLPVDGAVGPLRGALRVLRPPRCAPRRSHGVQPAADVAVRPCAPRARPRPDRARGSGPGRSTTRLAPGSAVSLLTGMNLRAHGAAPDGSEDVVRPR